MMSAGSARTLLFATLAAVAAASTAWSAVAQPAAGVRAAAPRSVAALGRLEPFGGILRLAAPSTPDAVSGAIVARLLVDRGMDVKAGQLLAVVDTAAIAEARLAETQADLETARRDATAAASVGDEACVLADVAARQAARKRELLRRSAVSAEENETSQGNAEAGAASCKARTSAARVSQARVATVQARLALRRAELERSYIRAPFAGRILDVLARPGESVARSGVLELGRVQQMLAIAEVYEADARFVKLGQRATIHSAALPRNLGGSVTRIRPKVQKLNEIGDDPAARKDAKIIEVEIRLDDSAAAANLTNLQVEIKIGR